MTANHEHTPLDDLVSRMHFHFGAANAMGDDFAADDFANVIRILENMPAKLAAAEQRGAARALRDAANEVYVEARWQLERKMHGQSHTIDSVDRLLEIEDLLRCHADRLEGDDE